MQECQPSLLLVWALKQFNCLLAAKISIPYMLTVFKYVHDSTTLLLKNLKWSQAFWGYLHSPTLSGRNVPSLPTGTVTMPHHCRSKCAVPPPCPLRIYWNYTPPSRPPLKSHFFPKTPSNLSSWKKNLFILYFHL